jgi:putative PIN family toxin of toxin-antitoxin system
MVVDVNTLVSAFLWHGVPLQILMLAEAGQITLFTSADLLLELDEVLHRTKFAKRVHATGRTVTQILRDYKTLATSVKPHILKQQICRDADDDAVLACALAARADIIVSGDKDLLALHPFRDIPILSPANVVRLLQRD